MKKRILEAETEQELDRNSEGHFTLSSDEHAALSDAFFEIQALVKIVQEWILLKHFEGNDEDMVNLGLVLETLSVPLKKIGDIIDK